MTVTVAKEEKQEEEEEGDVLHPKNPQVKQKGQHPSLCTIAGPTASPRDHSTQVPTVQHQKRGINGKPLCLTD
eukprot:9169111-Ditylum_brightwellii.AAC.1